MAEARFCAVTTTRSHEPNPSQLNNERAYSTGPCGNALPCGEHPNQTDQDYACETHGGVRHICTDACSYVPKRQSDVASATDEQIERLDALIAAACSDLGQRLFPIAEYGQLDRYRSGWHAGAIAALDHLPAALRHVVHPVIDELRAENERLRAAPLNDVSARLRRIEELVRSSDSYVPQDVAASCLLTLEPLNTSGGATLITLVERAMSRIAELEAVTGPILKCCGRRAVEHDYVPPIVTTAFIRCLEVTGDRWQAAPPEYLAWRESRGKS